MRNKKKASKIRVPKTLIKNMPKGDRMLLRNTMLKFIKDTHGALCKFEPKVGRLGAESALETLEFLHDMGYMRFTPDKHDGRYGFKIELYDDTHCMYFNMSNLWQEFKKLAKGDDHENKAN